MALTRGLGVAALALAGAACGPKAPPAPSAGPATPMAAAPSAASPSPPPGAPSPPAGAPSPAPSPAGGPVPRSTITPSPEVSPSPDPRLAALLDALAYPGGEALPGWLHPLRTLGSRNFRTPDAPEAAAAHYAAWAAGREATVVRALDPADARAEARALGFALAIAPPLAYEQPGRGMWRVAGGRCTVLLTYDPRRANADGEVRGVAPSPAPAPPLFVHIEAAVD